MNEQLHLIVFLIVVIENTPEALIARRVALQVAEVEVVVVVVVVVGQ